MKKYLITFLVIILLNPGPVKANTVDEYLKKGKEMVYNGKYEEAITSFDKILEMDNEHDEAWYYKGLVHYYLGKYDVAIKCFDNYLKYNSLPYMPEYVYARCNKGISYYYSGNYDSALKNVEKALEAQPDSYYAKFVYDALLEVKATEKITGNISLTVIKNSDYRIRYGTAKVELTDGACITGEAQMGEIGTRLTGMCSGTFNDDLENDALVVLKHLSGGRSTDYYIVAASNKEGEPEQINSFLFAGTLGQDVEITSMAVISNYIIMEYFTYKVPSTGPMCNAVRVKETLKLKVEDGEIVKKENKSVEI